MRTGTRRAAYAGYAWEKSSDGIVTVTMDDPDRTVNIMNEHYEASMAATVDRLEAERDAIAGVILVSAKKSWFAGRDLDRLRSADPARAAEDTARIDDVKRVLRRLERFGRPVVAAMNGTALGGGLEVALAAHHRIATDAPGAQFGLPEVSFGLLPGAGGTTRLVRMLGLERALSDVILPASTFSAERAVEVGIVDDVVPAPDLHAAARHWILRNPTPVKAWDEKGFDLPGGGPASPEVARTLVTMPAMLRKKTHGAPMPAPRAAMAAAVEGAYVDFETASQIETRYLVSLTHSQVAKNLINVLLDLQRVDAGGRPDGYPPFPAAGVVIVGSPTMSDDGRPTRWAPTVAGDHGGFFAGRAIDEFFAEAVAAVGEGVEPASVEQAARQAGYPASALEMLDEWSLPLLQKVRGRAHPAHAVIDWMVDEAQRPGRRARRGFYDYDVSRAPVGIWPGLREKYGAGRTELPLVDLEERMLFAGAIAAARGLDAGVLASVPDANIGSIRSVGFPAWTGGALQYINQYAGGLDGFIARCRVLAESYGDRFLAPEILVARAAEGHAYVDASRDHVP